MQYEAVYDNGQALYLHLARAPRFGSVNGGTSHALLRDQADVLARESEFVIEESRRVKRVECSPFRLLTLGT